MAYVVDLAAGQNPHVNYEPSITGGLREAEYPAHDEQGPEITGRLTRKRIPRTDDYTQPGQRYLLSEQWEKDELVANLVGGLSQCDRPIQERMLWRLFMAEDELGQRVGDGIGISADDVRRHAPLQTPDAHRGRVAASGQPRQERPARRQRPGHDALRAQRARRPGGLTHSDAPPRRRPGGPRPGLPVAARCCRQGHGNRKPGRP